MPRTNTRRASATPKAANADAALNARIEQVSRALTVGTRLAPVAIRLWRWRAVIRLVVSLALVAIPVIVRLRALRAAAAAEKLPAPYRLPRPVVRDDGEPARMSAELPAHRQRG